MTPDANLRPLDLVVTRRQQLADDVVGLRLTSPTGAKLPAWTPGAHLDLLLTDDVVRQYSLCGDPHDAYAYEIAVLRVSDGRGGSRRVHEHLKQGTSVLANAPRNNFPLLPAPRYLFIAGGIGITPILPMLEAATTSGLPWRLLYGGRSASSMAFASGLVDRFGDRITLVPHDTHGIPDLDSAIGQTTEDALIYACGPEPLLDAVIAKCADRAHASLQLERFQALPSGETTINSTFVVELAASGETFTVPPDRSILETLEDQGTFVMSSCREGTCGTCETVVIEGEAEHRDVVLSPVERKCGKTMMICVSRAISPRLILDL